MDLFQIAANLEQISIKHFHGDFMLFAVAESLPSFWVIDGKEELGTDGKKWLMYDGRRIAEADFKAKRVEWFGKWTASRVYGEVRYRLKDRMEQAASAIEEDLANAQTEDVTYTTRPPCGRADQLGEQAEALRERAAQL